MTKEEYLKKYGGNKQAGAVSFDDQFRSIFGTAPVNYVPVTNQDAIQATRDVYSGNAPSTPSLQQPVTQRTAGVTLPNTQPLEQDASSLRFAKENGTVLPSYNPVEAKKAATSKNQSSDFLTGWKSGWGSTKQLFAGATALAGKTIGSKNIEDWGISKYKKYESDINSINDDANVASLEDIHSVGDFADYAQYTIGSFAPSILESMGAAIVGGLAGSSVPVVGNVAGATAGFFAKNTVKAFLKKAVEEQLAKAVAKGATKGLTRESLELGARKSLNKWAGAGIATFANSYIQGLGDVYGETMDESGKGNTVAGFVGALPYAALDSLVDMSIFKSISRGTAGEAALKRFTKAVAGNAGMEGFNEAAQEGDLLLAGLATGKSYTGKEVLSRLGNSFAAGALGGGVTGLASGRKAREIPSMGTGLPTGERFALPIGKQSVIITPNKYQGQTIYQPERIGLKELGEGKTEGTAENAPLNSGFTMRNSGKIRKGAEPILHYGPIISAGNFSKIIETSNEIEEKRSEIVRELIGNGETKDVAKKIVSDSIALLHDQSTLEQGTTQKSEELTGLNKIAETGVVKSIAGREIKRNGKQVIEGTIIKDEKSLAREAEKRLGWDEGSAMTKSDLNRGIDSAKSSIIELENDIKDVKKSNRIGAKEELKQLNKEISDKKEVLGMLERELSITYPENKKTTSVAPKKSSGRAITTLGASLRKMVSEYDDTLGIQSDAGSESSRILNNIHNNGKITSIEEVRALISEINDQTGAGGFISDRMSDYEESDVEYKNLDHYSKELRSEKKRLESLLPDTTPKNAKQEVFKTEVSPIKTEEELRLESAAKASNRIKELQKKARERAQAQAVKKEKEIVRIEEEKKEVVTESKDKAESLYKAYQRLVSKEDYDFEKAMGIADQYEELTGRNIEFHEEYSPSSIDKASTVRIATTQDFDVNKMLDEMENERASGKRGRDMTVFYRLFKGKPKVKPQIGKESTARSTKTDTFIEDINSGKKPFSIANEAINIAHKFGVRLMKNLPGSEGHSVKNFIGLDSLNNPIVLAHEIVHSILGRGGNVIESVLSNSTLRQEAREVYVRYSPGALENIANADPANIINEGLAEFVSQSLFNPAQMSVEFPGLTSFILGTEGATSEKSKRFKTDGLSQIREVYSDVNNLIYTYQNISEEAQIISKQVNKIDTKKKTYGSIIVGLFGTKVVNYLNSRYAFGVIDSLDGNTNPRNNFNYTKTGGSTNMRAATFRKAMKISSNTFKETENATYMLSKDGKNIDKKLDFSVGNWLRGLFTDEHRSRIFGVYLSALDSQRDRKMLKDKQDKVRELQLDLDFTDKKTAREKIMASIEANKKDIDELSARIESKPTSDEQEKSLIARNKEDFTDDLDKFNQMISLHTDLQLESGVLSEKVAGEGRERPGYSQQFKFMVDEIEGFRGNEKRSSQVSTSKKRQPSSKPVINPALTISRVYLENVKKYYSQMFYNDLYESGKEHGFVIEVGEGMSNEPGVYVYAKGGKTIRFKVLDDVVTTAVEADFGSQEIKSPMWRTIHAWILKHPTRFVQKMTTSLSPYFVFGKNITIDIPTSYILSKTGYKPGWSQIQRIFGTGIYSGKRSQVDQYMKEYAMFNDSQVAISELGYDGINPYGVADKLLSKESDLRETYGRFLDLMSKTETLVRQEEYIRSRLLGDGVAEASEKADNVSLNYSQRGARMKLVNQSVMFLNSSTRAMYQMLGALTKKETIQRVGVAMAATSGLQIAAIARMIGRIDEEDEDKKDAAIQSLYQYLDKSTYEKNAYIPLDDGYKMPVNSFLAWPGTYIGHMMIEDYLGIKTNKAGVAYGGITSIIPGQILPDFQSGNPIASGFGKITGSTVVGNFITNIAGYKTFPEFKEVEGQSMKYKATAQRFQDNTNRLAIMLGQLVKDIPALKEISPVEFEAALRSSTGSVGVTLEDIAGELMMSEDDMAGLNLDSKTWSELLLKNPLKSSFVQSSSVLQGELVSPVYEERAKFESEKQNVIADYNKLLRSNGVKDIKKIEDVSRGWLSIRLKGESYNRASELLAKKKEIDKRASEIGKITDAIITAKQYKGVLPASYTNSLYRYASLLKEGKTDELDFTDNQRIKELQKEYNHLNDGSPKTNWRFQ